MKAIGVKFLLCTLSEKKKWKNVQQLVTEEVPLKDKFVNPNMFFEESLTN